MRSSKTPWACEEKGKAADMKDSTKEFLMAGAGFAGKLASAFITGKTTMTTSSARNLESHWDKAWELREKEKEAEKIPANGAFFLPPYQFLKADGGFADGGIWRKRWADGLRVFLYKKNGQEEEVRCFEWEDIKKYYDPSL